MRFRFWHRLLVVRVAAIFLSASTCFASSPKTTRIQRINFAPGQSTAVLRGRLRPYTNHIYRLRARSGQRLVLHLRSPANDVVFWVQSTKYVQGRDTLILDGIDRRGATDWSGELPLTDDYEIYVSNPPVNTHRIKRALPYSLEVSIT